MTTTTKAKGKGKAKGNGGAIADIDWTATFTEALNAPGALGNTYNRFYNYSFLNQIRLMMQGVMEPVATYKRWLELGRQVRKGCKAKTVLAPLIVTKRDKETGKVQMDGKDGRPQQVLIGFRESRSIFTYSDTDGDDLPQAVPATWDAQQALTELGVQAVAFRELDGNKQGYSMDDEHGRQVAINPVAVYPVKTLLHELAHIVLGHCKALAENPDMVRHTGIIEFEAESVAYLVAKEIELDNWNPSESRAYIADWLAHDGHDPQGSNGAAFDDRNVSRIFAAANKILVAGRGKSE